MNMYYGDLTEMWSNFSILVDNAVLLYYQERKGASKSCRTKKKTVFPKEKGEQRMKRIFDIFPRKTRSLLKKPLNMRNPLQNLNGASTSTSPLFDLNKIPADTETEDPQIAPQQGNSSSLTPLLVDCNMAESEKTKTKKSPNPCSRSSSSWCLTEKTSRKRRAAQDGKRNFKKAKVSPFFSWKGRNTPDWVVQLMKGINGAQDPILIFEKTLFETDVNPGQSRLSIPFNKLIRNDFLTPVESRIIEEDINNNEKMGVGAILVDQRTKKWGVILKRWEMKKDSGHGSWNYALVCGWNDIVKANGLKDGDNISLWSFRCHGNLCFALVPLPM